MFIYLFIYLFIYIYIYIFIFCLPACLPACCPALVRHSESLAVLVGTFTHLAAVSPLETILAGYAHLARPPCPPYLPACLVSMLVIW